MSACLFLSEMTGSVETLFCSGALEAEDLSLLLNGLHDSVGTGLQKLTGIKALALSVLACLDVLSGSLCEGKLALGVDVDLGNAQGDGLLDLVCRDAGTAVQYQGQISDLLLYLCQRLKGKSRPVCRIYAVDVADACCQEVNAKICDLFAFLRICALAHTYETFFLAADGAYLSLDGDALLVSQLYQLSGLCNVLLKGKVGTVEHDG